MGKYCWGSGPRVENRAYPHPTSAQHQGSGGLTVHLLKTCWQIEELDAGRINNVYLNVTDTLKGKTMSASLSRGL